MIEKKGHRTEKNEKRKKVMPVKTLARPCLCLLLLCVPAVPQSTSNLGFRSLNVDAGKVIGEIRSFQGMNGPASRVMEGLPTLVKQYKDLRVNQVRTHDAMGPSEIDSMFVLGNGELAWLIPDKAQRAGVVKAGNGRPAKARTGPLH